MAPAARCGPSASSARRDPGDAVGGAHDGLLAGGESAATAVLDGYHLAFWVAGAVVLAAIAFGLLILRAEARGEAAAVEPVATARVVVEPTSS